MKTMDSAIFCLLGIRNVENSIMGNPHAMKSWLALITAEEMSIFPSGKQWKEFEFASYQPQSACFQYVLKGTQIPNRARKYMTK